jgi:multicomponent K+:H+ antiporter subunit G
VSGTLPAWADALVAALLVAGAAFTLVGAFALAKLSDFYKRLHGPTKASTLGIGSTAIASAIAFSAGDGPYAMHAVLLALFVFLTAPVSAHMLVKCALNQARAAQRDGQTSPKGE